MTLFPHTGTQRTQSLLGLILGAVASFILVAITILGIAIAVVVYCKKIGSTHTDPVYDYIDTIDGPTILMKPVSHSLKTATYTAYGTT